MKMDAIIEFCGTVFVLLMMAVLAWFFCLVTEPQNSAACDEVAIECR